MTYAFNRSQHVVARAVAHVVLATTLTTISVTTLSAQEPTAQTSSQTSSSQRSSLPRTTTAAEYARDLRIHRAIGVLADDGKGMVPEKQIDTVLSARARQWIASLQRTPVVGLQLDPEGAVSVASGHDAIARQQFATRLATPGLSVHDRAYTLLTAVTAFAADATNAARMRIAREYATSLDSLPVQDVNLAQFHAHARIGRAYYRAGDARHAIADLSVAMDRVPKIPYGDRHWVGPNSIGEYYLMLADVLSGQPNGRAKIDAIDAMMLAEAHPPKELLQNDPTSEIAGRGRMAVGDVKVLQRQTQFLGRKAPTITAQYWWNTPTPAAKGLASKALDDGIIRVSMYGHLGCPGCMASLPKLDAWRKTLPAGVDAWYVTFGTDMWGATPCTADENAEHLHHFYVERKHYSLPIATWIGDRKAVEDGGTAPEGSPNFDAYGIVAFPTFIVTDGHGIVRHIEIGYSEPQLQRVVQFLVAEKSRSEVSHS